MALPKVTQYVRNVGKSIAFTAIDVVKDNSSGIKDFASTNETVFKEIYSSVKNYKRTIREAGRKLTKTKVFEAVNVGVKNLIEDAKTGNFYNEARVSEIGMSALGLDMDDWDSWDDDSFSSSSSSSDESSHDPVADAVNASGISQNIAIAESTGVMVENSQNNTKLVLAEMATFSHKMVTGFGNVNTGLEKVSNYLENQLQTHLENSKTYYENSMKVFQESQAMLKELVEMQRGIYAEKEKKREESMLEGSMTASGGIDMTGYFKNLKKNFKGLMDDTGLGMFDMDLGEGSNPLLLMAANPFSYILTPMVNKLLSSDFKKAIRSFDKGFTSLFSQAIARMNTARDKSGGGIWEWVGKLFGIEIDKKDSINVSNYKKGPVPFDGITKQTIVEVIPGYLARIEAALTGKEERYYDSHSGKWKLSSDIKKELDNEIASTIGNANYDIRSDLTPLIQQLKLQNEEAAKAMEQSMNTMINRVFKDGGDFRPNASANSEFTGYKEAWKYYGFRNEEEFKTAMRYLSRDTIRGIAQNNMEARQKLTRNFREHEENNGLYRMLYNNALSDRIVNQTTRDSAGNIINGSNGTVNTKGSGILAASLDEHNKNIFYYLQEILGIMKGQRRRDTQENISENARQIRNRFRRNRQRSTPSSSSESREATGTDGEPPAEAEGGERESSIFDTQINWEAVREQREKEQEEKRKKYETRFKNWINDKFGDSPVGKAISKLLGKAVDILDTPMKYATKLLNKADENMFQMMFGDNDYRNQVDENGAPITSIFGYIVFKVKSTFKEASEWIKKQFSSLGTQIKNFFKPIWDKYFKPVEGEAGNMFQQGFNRVKGGLNRTIGRGFRRLMGRETEEDIAARLQNGDVVTADDVANAQTSAAGRVVTKRGLTMISPGEMIIPATFNRTEQNKMLQAERRDRDIISRALGGDTNSIALNARGTINNNELRERLDTIYRENMNGNVAQVGAGGLLGAGAGLLTMGNPLLGALAGAGLSILKNSETFQNIVFGEDILDENGQKTGERQGGLISKKILDIFKENGSDILDYGIAGGAIGLLSPFGILGTAAIGAGVGYLKNTDAFQTFMFGDGTFDNQGLIDRDKFNSAINHIKKAVPAMAVGAVGGALLGPFGLIGNAALGAGIGLLSTTSGFKEFLFGDSEKKKRGLLHAIRDGILRPATEEITKIVASFKDYAKEWILKPLKHFWDPVKQMFRNIVVSTFTRVGDFLNNMFERALGTPIHDFLQEKVFRPITKLMFGIAKIPINLAKGAIGVPMKLLEGAGDQLRMAQIQRGTATNMSARQRLQFRDDHRIRNGAGIFARALTQGSRAAEMREQDEVIAGMTRQQIEDFLALTDNTRASRRVLQGDFRREKENMGQILSQFMNTEIAGTSNFTRLREANGINGSTIERRIQEFLVDGDMDGAREFIKSLRGIDNSQKQSLIESIARNYGNLDMARRRANYENLNRDQVNDEVARMLGRRVKNNFDMTNVRAMLQTELKSRGSEVTEEENGQAQSDGTQTAVESFQAKYEERTQAQLEILSRISLSMGRMAEAIVNRDANARFSAILGTNVSTTEFGNFGTELRYIRPTLNTSENNNENEEEVVDQNTGNVTNAEAGSKEEADNEDNREAINNIEERETEATEETNNILTRIKEGILGKARKVKESIAEKMDVVRGGFGTLLSFLGVGGRFLGKFGKYALLLGGASIFGHLTNWFKEKVWPMFSAGLFGKDVNGQTENLGLAYNIGQALNEPFMKIKDFLESEGGLQGLFLNKLLPKFLEGLQFTFDNVIAPATSAIIVALPKLLKGLASSLIKGIADGLAKLLGNIWPFGKDKDNGSITDKTGKVVEAAVDTSDLDSIYPGSNNIYTDTKIDPKKYGIDNNYGVLDSSYTSSGDSQYSAYNGEGNKITSESNSFLEAAGRNTVMGLAGLNSPMSKLFGAINKGSQFTRRIPFMGTASRIVGAGSRAAQGVLDISNGFGKAVRSFGQSVATAEDATRTAAKVTSKIGTAFEKLANSKIIATIIKAIGKMTGGKVTQEAVALSFKKIGKKLAKTVVTSAPAKALGKIVSKLAAWPVWLAMCAVDFYTGYKDAYNILGVSRDNYTCSFAEKIACGMVNMINQQLTLGLIPTSTIMDIIIEYIYPLCGLDAESLNAARAAGDQIEDSLHELKEEKLQEEKKSLLNNIEDYYKKNGLNTNDSTVTTLIGNIENAQYAEDARLNKYILDRYTQDTYSELYSPSEEDEYISGDGRKSGRGRGRRLFGKNHAYQKDPRISGLPYGDSTMGESGCGPVAAANLVNKFNGGVSPLDAARYAESHGMTTPGGGTDMSFFNSFLGSQGIPTTNTNSKASALNAIGQGNPVVMLGQDKKGGPGTPFGSNPHFITATGMDRSGNIIVEDPDLPQSSVKYNKNKVMNSMISSVIAGKGRRLYGKGNIFNNAIGTMMNTGVSTIRGITADTIARMAESEQGVTETGDNVVKYSYAYYGHNNGGAAWCCIFVWWVFTMCGARSSFFAALPNTKAQRCQNLADAFRNNNNPAGTWIPLEAMKRGDIKRGDVIFFHAKGGHSGTNHVGIVISDAIQGAKGWQCDTIEGNSTPSNQINGGMVYKWTRYADISRVNSSMEMYGAIRPNYPLAYNASDVLDMSKYGGGNELRVSPEESSGVSGGFLGDSSTGTTGGFFEQLAQAGRNMLGAMYGQDKVDLLFGNSSGTTSTTVSSSGYNSTGAVSPVDPSSLAGNSNAEKIYNYLRAMKYTPAGAAGIMGNLMAESGMNPQNLQNTYEKSFGLNDEQYTKAVDSGQWSKDKFINDKGGYGLAQWTSPGRKQVLYESSVEKGMSVGDLNAQLPVLNSDLNNYPDLVKFLRSTNDVNTASDRVLKEFERPAVLNYDKRRELSNNVYAQYGGKGRGDYVSSTDMMNSYTNYKTSVPSQPTVNMSVDRNTDSMSVISFLRTIIDVLIKISENTALLKKVLEVLSDKFKIDIDTSDVDKAKLDAKASLNKLMSRSSNNNTNISKLINNKDSQYLINAMMAIASE